SAPATSVAATGPATPAIGCALASARAAIAPITAEKTPNPNPPASTHWFVALIALSMLFAYSDVDAKCQNTISHAMFFAAAAATRAQTRFSHHFMCGIRLILNRFTGE